MRGQRVELKDIILEDLPEPVSLECDEVLQEEEEEQQVHGPIQETYQVSVSCGLCKQPMRFVCLATIIAVRQLQSLLFGQLDLVCVRCVRDNKLNHGG